MRLHNLSFWRRRAGKDEEGLSANQYIAHETTSNATGGSVFTETVVDCDTTRETGNTLTGDYVRTLSGSTTTTDQNDGTDAGGSFSVSESSTETYTGTQTRNTTTGAYNLNKSSSTTYSTTETGNPAAGGDAYNNEIKARLDNALAYLNSAEGLTAAQRAAAARQLVDVVLYSIWQDIESGALRPYNSRDVWLP